MKEKIAKLWAQKIISGERTLNEVPKGLLKEVKQELLNMLNK